MMRYRGIDRLPDLLLPKLSKAAKIRYFLWREACHLMGSAFLLVFSIALATQVAFPVTLVVFGFLAFWISIQEFYLHPRRYGQKFSKSIMDWSAWVAPFALYFLFV